MAGLRHAATQKRVEFLLFILYKPSEIWYTNNETVRRKKGKNLMKRKRVEYQKYLRTKFEQERYRELFGLTDNIALRGEEDIVLQREFRIDFSLQKKDDTIPTKGIFNYFKRYNILEFKSLNDLLNIVLMIKYLGQLLWWLYIRKSDAKEGKGHDISLEDVTLTIITVRRPREVLKELRRVLGNQLNVRYSGHYQWFVMGVEVHLVVINQLPVTREHYAWLSFAEGTKYQQYQENLAQDIQQNEEFQVYLELLQELEEEGKERMAYEIVAQMLTNMPKDKLQEVLKRLPTKKWREVLEGLPKEQLQEILKELSTTKLQETRESPSIANS